MSSDSSDDDDIPGLQSVSGSEVMEDESDDDFYEDAIDSRHYKTAKMWFALDRTNLVEHVEVVGIYVLCPLLYGHAHQSDRWLSWCNEAGILSDDSNFGVDSLSDRELIATNVIMKATNYVKMCLIPGIKEESDYEESARGVGGGGGVVPVGRRVEDMVRLLQIVEDVSTQETVEQAVNTARRRRWFRNIISNFFQVENFNKVTDGKISHLNKQNFVDVGFLFVFNQAFEHVNKRITNKNELLDEFHSNVELYEKSGEELRLEAEELEKVGHYDKAVEIYTMAIVCCPYYYTLYICRAQAYMKIEEYRRSVSDGVRAIHLRPGIAEGHIYYILALSAAGEMKEVQNASEEFNKRFPKERMELKRALERLRGMDRKFQDPSEKDRVMNEKLVATCKQASEEYLAGNVDESVFYFEEAMATSRQNTNWQLCWGYSDCAKFLVSLHLGLGLAYLRRGGMEDAEKALSTFTSITVDFDDFASFPTAYYGMGKSLVLLHRHSEALAVVKKGLQCLSSYHWVTLTWPGTNKTIQECHSHDMEMKLQQLQQQCEPVLADIVCRYLGCLSHHTSTDIVFSSREYKGHVELLCSDSCSIGYHTSCWRKFKGDRVIGADKELLNTLCPTPDCSGLVRIVNVYDTSNKVKIKLESEHSKKTGSSLSPALTPKETKKQLQLTKHKKKLDGGYTDKTTVMASSNNPPELASPEEVAKAMFRGRQDPKESAKEKETKDSDKGRSKRGSREEAVVVVETGLEVDDRKGEDVIQRHVQETTESGKGKNKKTKSHHGKGKSKASLEHCYDLLLRPDRSAKVGMAAAVAEDDDSLKQGHDIQGNAEQPKESSTSSGKSNPYHQGKVRPHTLTSDDHPPLSSNGAEDVSGSSYTRSNSNVSSCSSSSSGGGKASGSDGSSWQPSASDKDVLEFIVSFFGEIIRAHGPLDIEDPKILEPWQYLPETTRTLISKSGGIIELLAASKLFALQGRTICPIEDVTMVKDSLSSSVGRSSTSSGAAKAEEGGRKGLDKRIGKGSHVSLNSINKVKKNSGKNSARLGSGEVKKMKTVKVEEDDDYDNFYGNDESGNSQYLVNLLKTHLGLDSERNKTKEERDGEDSEALSEDVAMHTCSSHSFGSDDDDDEDDNDSMPPLLEDQKAIDVDLTSTLDKLLSSSWRKRRDWSSSSSLGSGAGPQRKGKDNKKQKLKVLGGRAETFSPTSSTCSASSNSSSSFASLQGENMPPVSKKPSKGSKNSKTKSSAGKSGLKVTPTPAEVVKVSTTNTQVQTEAPLMRDQWVMTDQQQHQVSESFKEKYEVMKKEKKDLQEKLETSEDQRFKMQKNHKRELDSLAKKTRKEVMEEMTAKVREMEEKVKDEKARVDAVRKEGSDQLKASKTEIKSLADKIEKMKKELSRKDQQADVVVRQLRTERDRLKEDKVVQDRQIVSLQDLQTKAISRATNAEVELLSMKREQIVRHCEQKIRDIDTFCATIPQGSDLYMECFGYSGRLKAALETYQSTMEEHIKLLKSGKELSSLEVLAPPTVPIPTHLSMFLMRHPGGFYPMMPSVPPGRLPPGVDPSMMLRGGPRLGPPAGMVGLPGGMVGVPSEGNHATLPADPSLHFPNRPNNVVVGVSESSGLKESPPDSIDKEKPPLNSSDRPPSTSSSAVSSSSNSFPGFPAVDKDIMIKPSTSGTISKPMPEMEVPNGSASPSTAVRGMKGAGTRSGKKSSFDRVLEKLTPMYPNYSRDDFKVLLREVRHNNKDSLSGVSVDFIAQQVKLLIEQKEKMASSQSVTARQPREGVGGTRGRGNRMPERNLLVDRRSGKKFVPPVSSVAHAPPPFTSNQSFSTEGSCIICYEDMDIFDSLSTRKLDCGHYFHGECIRSWFKEQNTCPTCRNHSLLLEDYPSLK